MRYLLFLMLLILPFFLELSCVIKLSSVHHTSWWERNVHVSPCSSVVSTLSFFSGCFLDSSLYGFQNFDHNVLRFILLGVWWIVEIIHLCLLPDMRDFWPLLLPFFPLHHCFSSLVPGFQLHMIVFLMFSLRSLWLCSLL